MMPTAAPLAATPAARAVDALLLALWLSPVANGDVGERRGVTEGVVDETAGIVGVFVMVDGVVVVGLRVVDVVGEGFAVEVVTVAVDIVEAVDIVLTTHTRSDEEVGGTATAAHVVQFEQPAADEVPVNVPLGHCEHARSVVGVAAVET